MSRGKSQPLKPFSLMVFTPVYKLEIPAGPKPAQRMHQDEDKTLTRGIWTSFLHGHWGLWKTLSWISIFHHTDGELSFPLFFVHPVCLNSFRMVFGEAQWDLNPGKVHGFFNNSDSAESSQFPQMSIVHIIYWFFPHLVSFPFLFSFFLWSFW